MVDRNWEDKPSSGDVLMNRSPQDCLTDCEVEDFLFGRLTAPVCDAVEEHLLFCGGCLARVQEEERFAAHLRVAARRLENEQIDSALGLRRLTRWQRLAAFLRGPVPAWAGAALLCTLLLALTHRLEKPEPPQEVNLQLVRGDPAPAAVSVSAGKQIMLRVDLTELPAQSSYQLDLVDAGNRLVESAVQAPAHGQLVWSPLRTPPAGQYWVRLSGEPPSRRLLREFSLPVH
jgi:hypothetical protein